MGFREITASGVDELRAFLAKDAVQNVFALGILEELGAGGASWYGLYEREALIGAALVGGGTGLANPCVLDPRAAVELAAGIRPFSRPRIVVGERAVADVFARTLGVATPKSARSQRLYAASADQLGPFVCPTLRPATAADLPELLPLSALAVERATGESPLGASAAAFARRVEARVAAGRTFVLRDGGALVAKADIGALSRQAAEVEGLIAAPGFEGKGLEPLVLGQLARSLLGKIPRVVTRVDERDGDGAVVCRKVGFAAMRQQRLLVLS